MIGYENSELFLFTKFRKLSPRVVVHSMQALYEMREELSQRDFLVGQQWLTNRDYPINFINLHYFSPQQAILHYEQELRGNVVQLDEHVHASEIWDIVQQIEPYSEFQVYRPCELDDMHNKLSWT